MFPGLILKELQAWRALSKAQRRYVYNNCVHQLLKSWRFKLVKAALMFPALWYVMMAANPLEGMLPHVFTVFVLIFGVGELVDLLFISLKRKEIDLYMQTHAEELAAV